MEEPNEVLAENRGLKAENQQRAAELAIVSSVQQALAAELDMHGMFKGKSESVRVFAVDG